MSMSMSMSFLFIIIVTSFGFFILDASAELERFLHSSSKQDGSLSFLVLGDWGRRGAYNQSLVAFQMGKVGEKLDIDFVVSTGDNFYENGLTGEDDKAFQDSFTHIYTAKSLQKQWYSVLGNHDYRGDSEAQLSPVLRQIDSRWLCLRSFIVDSDLVQIFFVDTTPFLDEYFTQPNEYKYHWQGIGPQKPYITNLLKELELALRESTAKWKIVVGHHAIRSVGHHGDTQELINQLLPILRANNVDFYMNGHDHCLQHMSDTESPIQLLTSGAGSKAWRRDIIRMNRRGLNFFYSGQGFMSVKLTHTDATIDFYDVFGNVLHRLTSSKQLHSSTVGNMGGLGIWLGFISVCIVCVSGLLQRLEHPVKADGSLSFVVIGDWGRKGTYNQSEVATQMGRVAATLNIDFVISTGDNFYDDGLTGIDDPAFENSFSKIYTAKSLQKQWYNVLGNHDYRGDVEAQLNPILQKIDPRWICQRSFILDTEIAEFFFVDTTPFVDKYFLKPKDHKYDWRGVLPREKYLLKLLKDLEIALKDSTANWKIVVGHHTIRSIGHHGDTQELVKQLLPILEANDVDMYINGHDHCLEHISSTSSQIQFLTSGGGSKAWKGDIDEEKRDGVKFYYDGQGFMSLEIEESNAKVVYYDIFGKVLHVVNMSKGLRSASAI
ncbi:Purple acid phosphatase 17 [Mucuna pruriens]|uniref:acid phosphatase n=1 Tax=Mucuna pruriens TaxID=157652 RepID=A0A371FB74_MUCPR|nr:Purple acid phosphatase 17 [Mucuna pruriens]